MASETRKELSQWDKGRIEGRHEYMTDTEIGHELHIPRQTISNFLTHLRTRHTSENLPRPGRPRITTKAQDKRIIHAALTHTHEPFAALQNIVNVPASTSTIRRRLHNDLIRKWRALDRALLDKTHAKKRLAWAKAHQHLTRDDWAKVVWSDECPIQKDSARRQIWVFRHQTKAEKYAPQNVRGKTKEGDLVQMVWGCFMGNKLGPIVSITGHINSDAYVTTLRDHLTPFLEALANDGITDIIFQQDNSPVHSSKKTREFLETVAIGDKKIQIIEWPPHSPDMNPIENLWAYLKLELNRLYPDTLFLHGSHSHICELLSERSHKVWWSIAEGILDRLIDSMPHRVQALIDAKGWYTEY